MKQQHTNNMENVIARLDRDLNLDRFVKKTCFSFNVVARIKLQSCSCPGAGATMLPSLACRPVVAIGI